MQNWAHCGPMGLLECVLPGRQLTGGDQDVIRPSFTLLSGPWVSSLWGWPPSDLQLSTPLAHLPLHLLVCLFVLARFCQQLTLHIVIPVTLDSAVVLGNNYGDLHRCSFLLLNVYLLAFCRALNCLYQQWCGLVSRCGIRYRTSSGTEMNSNCAKAATIQLSEKESSCFGSLSSLNINTTLYVTMDLWGLFDFF